ncbi:MAG: isochorismatase family protein [Nocardioides sp.]
MNAFASSDLEERLHADDVDRLVICAIRTEQCVETTARAAAGIVERTVSVLAVCEFVTVVTPTTLSTR